MNLAFKHFFGFEPDASTKYLKALTPSDFVVVKNKMNIADNTKMLETEQAVKKSKPKSRIGF